MKLTEQIKQALSALAHAEAGEMLSRREKLQTLIPDSSAQAQSEDIYKTSGTRKMVALSLGSDPANAAVRYAVSVCHRMGADLSVLCDSTRAAASVLARYQDAFAAANITCRTVGISGNRERAIKQYLQAHSELIFVVSSGSDDPVQALISSGSWAKVVNAASIPVVMAHDHHEHVHTDQHQVMPDSRAVA